MSDKIVNFQQRRQLEQAFAALAQSGSEAEVLSVARKLVNDFPAAAIIPLLVKNLDTVNSQLRGGLHRLAALLPQEEMTTTLSAVVADQQRSPQARMTALSIAEQALGLELPTALISDLGDSDNAAMESLREAVAAGKQNRHIFLEYVLQMQQHDEEIAFLVLDALHRLPAEDRVELLRLIAQDARPTVAGAALIHLERLIRSDASPATVAATLRALHILQFALTGTLRQQAERALRKLRMAGKRYDPPATEGWRALLSPAEINGSQSLWLIRRPAGELLDGSLLGFVLNLNAGVLRVFASENLARDLLPDAHPLGTLVNVNTDEGGSMTLLEVPFAYGQWLAQQALALHQTGKVTLPLSSEFTLYNDLFWQFAPPEVDEEIKQLLQRPTTEPGVTSPTTEQLAAYTQAFFAHPAQEGWAAQGRALMQMIRKPLQIPRELPVTEVVQLLLRELTKWPEQATLQAALAAGLRTQAGWLHYAGSPALAQQAHLLATYTQHAPLDQNPVLIHLLVISLGQ